MKKKNLLMFALAGLLFASCSNDDVINDGDGDIATDPKGDAWIALDIKPLVTPGSRALHNPDQENGTADETTITTVRVLFFTNEADPVLIDDVTLTAAAAGNPGQPTGGVSDPIQVTTDAKRILIVANPSAKFTTFSAGTPYSVVNAAIDNSNASNIATAGNFMMSNAKGGLEPSENDGTDKDLVLYKTKAAAQSNPLAINIDRVAAKVRVYVANDAAPEKAQITDPGWILNVTNKKYFPVSKRELTWNEIPGNGRGSCITPFDLYKIGSYRIDPNYDSQGTVGDAAYKADYDYYDSSSNPTTISWNSVGSAEYCLENTQKAEYNYHAYTTQVLFKAVFSPKKLKKVDNTTLDVTPGDSWLSVKGVYYTYETLMDWIEVELINKYKSGDPDLFNASLTNSFNAYLTAISESPVTIPDAAAYASGTYNDNPEGQAAYLKTAFNNKKNAVTTAGAGTRGDISYFAGGVSYYKIMIKHDDTDAAINELGEFGVVRNSVYDVNITAINNPGTPVIPDPDPTIPDESDKYYLSVQINVNPWTWYTQEEIL